MTILAGRCQLIGDQVAALPIASFFRRQYPNAKIIWPCAKKVSQAAPLYLMHPDIDQIYIYDGMEGPESKEDYIMHTRCDIVVNPNPQHPDNRYPREFNIYSETWRMAGLDIFIWNALPDEQKRPKLYKWWKDPELPRKNTSMIHVAYWPQAGYGKENKRNASYPWRVRLVEKLHEEGFIIHQFGSENDDPLPCVKHNSKSFLEQIQLSPTCDIIIGTDSGSALILGCYQPKQISLLTDHWGNPHNLRALEVDNPNNRSF